MIRFMQQWIRDESGQGMSEYALIIALVAIGLVTIMVIFRNSIGNIFRHMATVLDDAPGNQYP